MPKLSEFFFGPKEKKKQVSTLDPMQKEIQKLIKQALETGEGPFADILGPFNLEQFKEGVEKPALATFREQVLPQIQEQYIAGNQSLGSGMRRGKLKAAQDLQTQLAGLLYQAQQQQQQNRLTGLQNLYGRQTVENIYQKPGIGVAQALIAGLVEGGGQALGGAYSGGSSKAATPSPAAPSAAATTVG